MSKKGDSPMAKIDLTSAAYKANPRPSLERLHAEDQMGRVKLPIIGNVDIAVSYEAALDVVKKQDCFAVDARNAGKTSRMGFWLPKSIRLITENMLQNDDPDHRRLRKLADVPFHARNIEAQRPAVTAIADRLLDDVAASDAPELVQQFCTKLPLGVICEILGIEPADRDVFAQWMDGMSGKTSMLTIIKFLPRLKKVMRFLRDEIEARRKDPKPGMITELVQAEQDGDKLTETELLAMILILFIAGHETTTHVFSSGIPTLLSHREQLEELSSNWNDKAPRAVEELIRYNSPVQMTKPRYVREDMEFYGRALKKGKMIMAFIAGANSDARQFDDPFAFDINRENVRHIGFGGGIHLCLGIQLARLEVQVGLERLFTRFPNLSLAQPYEDLNWVQRLGTRGVTTLPVKLA